jgi:hypothetical protein
MDIDILEASQGSRANADTMKTAVSDIAHTPSRDTDSPSPCFQPVVFGSEMVVIASPRGSSARSTITINFQIDDLQLEYLSKWNNHKQHSGYGCFCYILFASSNVIRLQVILKTVCVSH